ncbi:MAG: hypothetical protein MK132_06045 [Lentisphaerales bacterium]|nr:hypothetical protein [Lentisphaerales bacterium]
MYRNLICFIFLLIQSQASDKPNFIFILADGMEYADVEWRTPGIPTPNLAKLRVEGVELPSH